MLVPANPHVKENHAYRNSLFRMAGIVCDFRIPRGAGMIYGESFSDFLKMRLKMQKLLRFFQIHKSRHVFKRFFNTLGFIMKSSKSKTISKAIRGDKDEKEKLFEAYGYCSSHFKCCGHRIPDDGTRRGHEREHWCCDRVRQRCFLIRGHFQRVRQQRVLF